MFYNRSTKAAAAISSFLLGAGSFAYLLLTVADLMQAYRTAPFDFVVFATDAATVGMLFFVSTAGFLAANELRKSVPREGTTPSFSNQSWLHASAAFLFAGSYAALRISRFAWTVASSPDALAQYTPQELISNTVFWGAAALVSFTLFKLALNSGLELMLFERATPHLMRRLFGGSKPKARKTSAPKK